MLDPFVWDLTAAHPVGSDGQVTREGEEGGRYPRPFDEGRSTSIHPLVAVVAERVCRCACVCVRARERERERFAKGVCAS